MTGTEEFLSFYLGALDSVSLVDPDSDGTPEVIVTTDQGGLKVVMIDFVERRFRSP